MKSGAGCCRYMSVLFYILGVGANLGTDHQLRSFSNGWHTSLNSFKDECGEEIRLSIFSESTEFVENSYLKNIPLQFVLDNSVAHIF